MRNCADCCLSTLQTTSSQLQNVQRRPKTQDVKDTENENTSTSLHIDLKLDEAHTKCRKLPQSNAMFT